MEDSRIFVVLPAFKSKNHILDVIEKVGPEVDSIIVVDDGCPEETGQHVKLGCNDPRVTILFHDENQGVGGATVTGFKHALHMGADIIVKIDSDGQMDPRLIYRFITPIKEGECDYAKGNRFYSLEYLWCMPPIRKIGNGILSFLTKLSSGYWDIMDPTNGYVAIHSKILRLIPLDKLEKRFLFETDLLFRLNIIKAVVRDVPMESKYAEEKSNLNISKEVPVFIFGNLKRFFKRLFYNYFLRDFNIATVAGLLGTLLVGFGTIFGAANWYAYSSVNVPAPTGIIMLAALPIVIGTLLLLTAINFDISHVPKKVLHKSL